MIMTQTGANNTFTVETFLREMNLQLLHIEVGVLTSFYDGINLFRIEKRWKFTKPFA